MNIISNHDIKGHHQLDKKHTNNSFYKNKLCILKIKNTLSFIRIQVLYQINKYFKV